MAEFARYRDFLKDSIRKRINFRISDQYQGIPEPPLQEPVDPDAPRISLPREDAWKKTIRYPQLMDAIAGRRSRRRYNDSALSIEELSFLLWSTQGLRDSGKEPVHFRTVPSAGARHSFETYLFVNRVQTLPTGVYRYLPLSHELVLEYETDQYFKKEISSAVLGQQFVANSAVVFVWTTVPYRMEWRYLQAAHRVILLDCGHVCQNLYLACEALGIGTCAIAAYDQEAIDAMLKIDGEEQFTIYLAPVGKYSSSEY